MTAPSPGRFWFVDTSSLMSMALSPDLRKIVLSSVGKDPALLLDVVVDELTHREDIDGPMSLAAKALGDLAWLGSPVDTGPYVDNSVVLEIQEQVADGRALKDEYEHWAESVAIAMMRATADRGSTTAMMFLTEDHSARVQANKEPHCDPASLYRLMWEHVQNKTLEATEAERLAQLIDKAGRGPDCTAADFTHPNRRRSLGRVGRP